MTEALSQTPIKLTLIFVTQRRLHVDPVMRAVYHGTQTLSVVPSY